MTWSLALCKNKIKKHSELPMALKALEAPTRFEMEPNIDRCTYRIRLNLKPIIIIADNYVDFFRACLQTHD